MRTETSCLWIAIAIGLATLGAAHGGEDEPAPILVSGSKLRLTSDSRSLEISLCAPEIAFTNGVRVGPAEPTRIMDSLKERQSLTVEFASEYLSGAGLLERSLHLEWYPEENVLRKSARIRLTGVSESWVIDEIVFDRLPAGPCEFRGGPPQSYPVFLEGFFAGVEFPVATTRIEGDHAVLSHAPGVRLEAGVWYESRKAVYGPAGIGAEMEEFQRYIARLRPMPHNLHVNYNSWWTSSVPFTEEEILGLMTEFRQRLYEPHGVSLNTFAIDLGWSDDKSIWRISRERFPEGFANIQAAVEEMDGNLGLWISPTAFYGAALDTAWARDNGHETMMAPDWTGATMRICCLGGPNYATAFKEQLVALVRTYDIRHVKLDGYMLTCSEADHGHEPGALSAEACALGGIAAFEAAREALPDIWLEATCFGWNPSPWWLLYVNSVIGTFGDDSPHARVPAPVYWESKVTARDYFNLQGAALLPIPDAAQEVLGLIVQTDDPWMNDGVVVATRGHMFMPLYVNPRFMNERRWAQLAGLITWTRANADIIGHDTKPLLPVSWQGGKVPRFSNDEVMPREPYGYAHWKGDRGLITLRNPWIAPADYEVVLSAETEAPLQVVSLYPEARVYASDVVAGTPLRVPLAPYETLVLQVAPGLPTNDLPMAAPTERSLSCEGISLEAARIVWEGDSPGEFGADWTNLSFGAGRAARVNLSGRVLSTGPKTELLVLLEGAKALAVPETRLVIDGTALDFTIGPSEAGWTASSIPVPSEHWLFLRAPVEEGRHEIAMEILAGAEVTHLSAWLWAYREGIDPEYPNALPAPEILSLEAVPLIPALELGAIEQAVTAPPRIDRIDGVYLDVLEPLSVSQGWGELQRNRSVTEKPLRIAGRTYRRGLGTHAVSHLTYNISAENWRSFSAWAGLDSAGTGTIRFRVLVDGIERWDSGTMRAQDPPKQVLVDVTHAETLELVVDDAGDDIMSDHANWADAKLLR